MPVKVTLPDGTKIEADSPKEVGETVRAIKGESSGGVTIVKRPIIPPRPLPSAQASEGNGFDPRAVTLELLEAIKAAGQRGVPSGSVQKIVHADHPKGVGGRMVRINGFLKTLGFDDTKHLFDNPRDRDSTGRVWKPKRDIDAAIEAVRKAQE